MAWCLSMFQMGLVLEEISVETWDDQGKDRPALASIGPSRLFSDDVNLQAYLHRRI